MPGCHIVKLGGSLITSLAPGPGTRPVLDRALVAGRLGELARSEAPIVLVHGTGTYGKPPARAYGYLDGKLPPGQHKVVAQVSTLLARMELELLECAQDAGLHPFRLPVTSLARYVDGQVQMHGADLARQLLTYGITPVVGGNFAYGTDGFAVYSSDNIALDLAIALGARSVVMAVGVPGVLRGSGSDDIYTDIDAWDPALSGLADPEPGDVTGGMRRKIQLCAQAAKADIPAFIVDGRLPGNLAASLAGNPLRGTRVWARQAVTDAYRGD